MARRQVPTTLQSPRSLTDSGRTGLQRDGKGWLIRALHIYNSLQPATLASFVRLVPSYKKLMRLPYCRQLTWKTDKNSAFESLLNAFLCSISAPIQSTLFRPSW